MNRPSVRTMNRLYLHVILLLLRKPVQSDTSQSLLIVYQSGTDFLSANPIELLATYIPTPTFDACFNYCHRNIRCRTFVSTSIAPFSCHLYEGLSDTGIIIPSISLASNVGSIQYYPQLYDNYGQPCDPALPLPDRYLVCQSGFWRCPINTYWDGSLCLNAVYYHAPCTDVNQCRQDIGLECNLLTQRCACNATSAWNVTSCDESNNGFSSSAAGFVTSTMSNFIAGNGYTQRYHDCCKTSCAWPGKAVVTSPVQSCAQDGFTPIDNNTRSVCDNGTAYVCDNQQPWNITGALSYGFSSANLLSYGESTWCCACFSLMFTAAPLLGKEMIVQVTSTNSGPGNCFGLQIPGAGWGSSPNACETQFNVSSVWGFQYGGISNRTDCTLLPAVIQPGCYWRFDWLMDAQNPNVTFQEVFCPSALTSITGCQRL